MSPFEINFLCRCPCIVAEYFSCVSLIFNDWYMKARLPKMRSSVMNPRIIDYLTVQELHIYNFISDALFKLLEFGGGESRMSVDVIYMHALVSLPHSTILPHCAVVQWIAMPLLLCHCLTLQYSSAVVQRIVTSLNLSSIALPNLTLLLLCCKEL